MRGGVSEVPSGSRRVDQVLRDSDVLGILSELCVRLHGGDGERSEDMQRVVGHGSGRIVGSTRRQVHERGEVESARGFRRGRIVTGRNLRHLTVFRI